MNIQRWTLHSFSTPNLRCELTATITRRSNTLVIQYAFVDPLGQVDIPPIDSPTRQDNLWQATCFEFFLATRDATPYWEFNLSPSANWNVYHFDAYRQGMRTETAFDELLFRVTCQDHTLVLDLEIDVEKIIPANQSIQLGITAVIKLKNGDVSYWAIAHRGEKPDFHLRESFIAELTADD